MFLLGTYFTLEEVDVTGMLAYIGNLTSDAGLLIVLAIGLPLAFWVIRRVVGMIRLKG